MQIWLSCTSPQDLIQLTYNIAIELYHFIQITIPSCRDNSSTSSVIDIPLEVCTVSDSIIQENLSTSCLKIKYYNIYYI